VQRVLKVTLKDSRFDSPPNPELWLIWVIQIGVNVMKSLIAALFVFVLSWSAEAGVTYDWENLTPSVDGYTISGRVIFTNEAGHNGRTDGIQKPDDRCNPNSGGISSLELAINSANGNELLNFTMSDTDPIGYCSDFPIPLDGWRYSFQLKNLLRGSIYTNMSSSWDIEISGGKIWGVDLVGSDFLSDFHCDPVSKTLGDPCSGLTGRWIKTSGAIPESSAVFLIVFALLGLLVCSRHFPRYGKGLV
jgi:hypothetical protein